MADLDSMTYKELLEEKNGFSSKVTEYFDPIVAISMVLSAVMSYQLILLNNWKCHAQKLHTSMTAKWMIMI